MTLNRLALLLTITLFACSTSPKKSGPAAGSYKVIAIDTLEQEVYDTIRFGRVGEGEVLAGAFLIKNLTPKPVVIANILTGCGCTTTTYEKQPLNTGEQRQIEFKFDTRGKHGFQFQSIDILTTDHQLFRLFVEAEVTARN